jgi:hypothetical protein
MKTKWTGLTVALGMLFSLSGGHISDGAPPQKKSSAGKLKKANKTARTASVIRVLPASKVHWQKLNPARGNKSPKAATLWGDRKGKVPTGFLVQFVDGFQSPPHIHNVSYRGIVISGLVHNDDPKAAAQWMPPGSYWTQPKGEVHITAAKGKTNIAFIEIDSGPYLVMPTKKAFDSGERPVNIDISNLVWLKTSNIAWFTKAKKATSSSARLAFLWGNPTDKHPSGSLLKLPAGFRGALLSPGGRLRAVVIQGTLGLNKTGNKKKLSLPPGSYFSSTGKTKHVISCKSKNTCLLYVRMNGVYDLRSH